MGCTCADILGLVENALWPLVTLILVGGTLWYVRKDLTLLLRRRVKAKYGSLEVLIDPEETARRQREEIEQRISQVETLLEQTPVGELPPPQVPQGDTVAPTDVQVAAVEAAILSLCPTQFSKTTVQNVAATLGYQEALVVACVNKSQRVQFDHIETLARQGFVYPARDRE